MLQVDASHYSMSMRNSAFCLDRLVESGAIPGDSEADIRLEVSQIQVTQAKEIGTSVRIIYP
jgi:hypothetical protein